MESNSILIVAAFLTAIISGTIGMGGGILLFTVMANFLPPLALIPLHGIVQLTSNLSRTALNWRYINRAITITFVIGALIGAVLGLLAMLGLFGSFVETSELALKSTKKLDIPESEYKVFLGCFILALTWLPKVKNFPKVPWKFAWVGAIATFLSLFVGATGPIIAPFYLREGLEKETLVVTKAAGQATVHTLKLLVFFYLGFKIGHHLGLIINMGIAVFFGNWIGKHLLGKISPKFFLWSFRIVITLLAVRMIAVAIL